MTKRCRPEDPLDISDKRFRVIQAVVPVTLYDELLFLNNKRLKSHHVKRASIVIRCEAGEKDGLFNTLFADPMMVNKQNKMAFACSDGTPTLASEMKAVLQHRPVCTAFLMGICPQMGRNESWWIDVDADTRKRVRTPPESYVYRAFVQHELAEKQCMRIVFSFLF
jgi:hypothetical protein